MGGGEVCGERFVRVCGGDLGGGVEEDLLYISYENKETENKDPRG